MYSTYIWCTLVIFSYGKYFWSLVYVFVYRIGSGASTLMFISDGLDTYIFCWKMEKKRFMKEEMDEKVFISRQSRHFSFINNMIIVLFPNCTSDWRVNNYNSRQGTSIYKGNQFTVNNI